MRLALRILAAQSTKYANVNPDTEELVSNDRWRNIAQAIEELSGVKMGSKDRLRQFAMGYPNPDSPTGRAYGGLSHTKLQAVADFLTDPMASTAPLPRIELEEFLPDLQAPLYLLEYLRQNTIELPGLKAEQLVGTFIARRRRDDHITVRTLTAEGPIQDGAVSIVMFEDQYLLIEDELADEEDDLFQRRSPDQTFRYKGWAVISNEDSVIAFVKREQEGANHLFSTMAVNGSAFLGDSIQILALLDGLYPLELEDFDGSCDDAKLLSVIDKECKHKLLIFRRKQ